jgi:hypothetical protein
MPTLVAAAGDPDIENKLLQGYSAGDKTAKGASRWLASDDQQRQAACRAIPTGPLIEKRAVKR